LSMPSSTWSPCSPSNDSALPLRSSKSTIRRGNHARLGQSSPECQNQTMLRPMPPTDSLFLLAETREQPMHVGSLQLFVPPDGASALDIRAMFDAAIEQDEVAPLFQRRPRRSVTSLGQWGWEPDQQFDLEHHVRRSALPEPGRILELLALCSRLHSTLLDRKRPPWEMHLIEGLADGRYAAYFKVHHSLVDGVSALRLLSRMMSPDPDERDMKPPWAVLPRQRRQREGGSPADSARDALKLLGLRPHRPASDPGANRNDVAVRAEIDAERADHRRPPVRCAIVADGADSPGRQGRRCHRQ
jgi:WS/DGAT/MGAT family acyltransferase